MALAPTMKAFSVLAIWASLSSASPMLAPRQSTNTLLGSPLAASGPYPFVSCKASQGAALASLFPEIADNINNEVIPNIVAEGKRDRVNNWQANLYSTFFGANQPSDVQAVFQAITARSEANSAGGPIHPPNIICLNEDVAELSKALAVCDAPMKPTSFTRKPLGSAAGANTDIYLCPSFWDLEAAYASRDQTHCPTVTDPETYSYAGDNNIAQTQSSTIIHALAHIYAPAPLAFTDETYPINGLLGLDTSDKLNNANNYAYLAAVIHAACPSFYDLNGDDTTHQGALADTSTATIPAVLDDWAYDIAFDANALQANLTALGH